MKQLIVTLRAMACSLPEDPLNYREVYPFSNFLKGPSSFRGLNDRVLHDFLDRRRDEEILIKTKRRVERGGEIL